MNDIILTPVPVKDLMALFRSIVKEEMIANAKHEEEKLISGAEACKVFSPAISIVTLGKWVADGRIKSHRVGGRVYYRSSEIIEAATTIRKYSKNLTSA